jgi:hypothetical protein
MRTPMTLAVLFALALLAATSVDAAVLRWEFSISGDQIRNNPETLPDGGATSPSLASGSAVFSYDLDTELLTYRVEWLNPEGDLLKMHVHGPASYS